MVRCCNCLCLCLCWRCGCCFVLAVGLAAIAELGSMGAGRIMADGRREAALAEGAGYGRLLLFVRALTRRCGRLAVSHGLARAQWSNHGAATATARCYSDFNHARYLRASATAQCGQARAEELEELVEAFQRGPDGAAGSFITHSSACQTDGTSSRLVRLLPVCNKQKYDSRTAAVWLRAPCIRGTSFTP